MSRHVLVVGGGVLGLSTAYYAARRGLRVTLLDRGGPEDQGCSHGNAGLVVPSHVVPLAAPGMVAQGLRYMLSPESPFYVRPRPSLELLRWGLRFWRAANARQVARAAPLLRDLHLASRACFEELETLGDGCGLRRQGLLMLCQTPHGLREETHAAALARSLGIPAEVLTAAEAQALEPGLRLDVVGAVHYPLDCHLDPSRLLALLRRELAKASVSLLWNTGVTGWRTSGGRVRAAVTTRGELSADEYVLAAGVWSAAMARDLGWSLPLQAGKGYSLTLARPRRQPSRGLILAEARVAVTPLQDALRFGGTLELTGIDPTINAARIRGITNAVPRYLPDFTAGDFDGVPAWHGLRPCSPDGLPYLGRSSRLANLSVASGHAMMGVSLGPISGKLLAQMLEGEPPDIDVTALRPGRFS